jgi:type IV pilus assembly protein PilB
MASMSTTVKGDPKAPRNGGASTRDADGRDRIPSIEPMTGGSGAAAALLEEDGGVSAPRETRVVTDDHDPAENKSTRGGFPSLEGLEPLGAILLQGNFVTAEELRAAVEQQKQMGQRLGTVLINMGFTTPDAVLGALSLQLGLPAVRLNGYTVHPEAVTALPEKVGRKHQAFPLQKVGRTLKVAIAAPKDLNALDDIRFASGCRIETVIALEDEIREAFDRYYLQVSADKEVAETEEIIVLDVSQDRRDHKRSDRRVAGARHINVTDLAVAVTEKTDEETERSAVRVVDRILVKAIGEKASDIHFEPMEDTLRVRARVDGMFRDVAYLPTDLSPAILTRLKVMAGMDIAERRVPQDGRFTVVNNSHPLDLRASTFPVVYGEKMVLRLLDHSQINLRLDLLGISEHMLTGLRDLIHRPQGMILITGPTGSGKSSTLYAVLAELIETGKNIVTIEDPVEYALQGINQGQTNDKAGFTFAKGLRAILRQDPDVIMVGEIRDTETLNTAIEASLTGHLVLSTLHTNSAAATIVRLVEMELEPYLLAASVQGIVAQRLVRQICQACREEFHVPAGVARMFADNPPPMLYRGKGCRDCRGTGYRRGRVGIFELLKVNDEIRDLVLAQAPENKVLEASRRSGTVTLREECLNRVRNGDTTLEELVRITQMP